MFCALRSTLTSSGISVASHLFGGECGVLSKCVRSGEGLILSSGCQWVEEEGRCWETKAISNLIWNGQQEDNGERESALVLINTVHKALRCSLRHFTRPLSGTGKRAAKPAQRGKVSHADGEHGGSFLPDETLHVDRMNGIDGNRPHQRCFYKNLQTAR